MEIVKFQNEARRRIFTYFLIIFAIILFYFMSLGDIPLVLSFVMIIVGIYSFHLLKLATKEIEELIISPDQIQIYVFNKKIKPIKMKKSELLFVTENDKISFIDSQTKKTIAIANKNQLMEIDQWKIICDYVKQ